MENDFVKAQGPDAPRYDYRVYEDIRNPLMREPHLVDFITRVCEETFGKEP